MSDTPKDFLWTVFNHGEWTAGADNERQMSRNFGLDGIFPVEELLERNPAKFCINPLKANVRDRSDANLSDRRTFLIEIDKDAEGKLMSEAAQAAYIDDLKMPWSTRVWTGGKSLHHLIVLDSDIDPAQYDALRDRLHGPTPGKGAVPLADFAARLKCQVARWPGHLRNDEKYHDEPQHLRAVEGRIPLSTLDTWLTERGFKWVPPQPVPIIRFGHKISDDLDEIPPPPRHLSRKMQILLFEGPVPGENNNRMTRVAMAMITAGYQVDAIFEKLNAVYTTQSDREIWASIHTAERKAERR
jgi:hypothetical protein